MDGHLPTVPVVLPRPPSLETPEPRHSVPRWLSYSIWLVFLAVWAAIGFVELVSGGATAAVMEWLGQQTAIVEVVLWLLFLPVVTGLAVWESGLALWLRILVLVACVAWTTFGMYPRKRKAGS